MQASDFDIRGRAEKAAAIVEQIEYRAAADGLTPQGDAAVIVGLLELITQDDWAELQHAAGYRRKGPPSAKTQRLVIDTFRSRMDVDR